MTTSLLLLFAFGVSKTLLLLGAILFIPVCFYFWISSSGLTDENPEKNFGKGITAYIVSVFCISAVLSGIGLYIYTSRLPEAPIPEVNVSELNSRLETLTGENAKLTQELADRNRELEAIKSASTDYIPPDEDKKVLGFIKLTGKGLSGSIFKEKDASSEMVGTFTKDEILPYYEKSGNWYFVITDKLVSGWVYNLEVTETDSPEVTPAP